MKIHDKVTELIGVEGVYSNHPDDRGGETFCGISRVHHPSWEGWPMVDSLTRLGHTPLAEGSLRTMVNEFYQRLYWTPLGADHLPPAVANELFEQAVNLGVGPARMHLQQALNVLNRNGTSWPEIAVDGQVGPITLRTLGRALTQRNGERDVVKVLNTLQGAQYIRIVLNDPTQETFLRGWLQRT